ncbi:MAG TPA: hypothetical protein PLX03_10670, partial [Candidatus Hydrogenedentes bacterium]|nr:hypothetical protein [Candidatus Hydrogenedentota bacterium]
RRFQRREEIPPMHEVAALGCALILGGLEMRFLREALERFPVYYVFSAIGVLITLSALYGHLVASLISRLLLEWITTGTESDIDRPLFGAGEACMRRGDYANAAREFTVLARLHPRDPAVFLRLGEALAHTGDHRRAVAAFLRCAQLESNSSRALHALRRATDCLSPDNPEQKKQFRDASDKVLQQFPEDTHLASQVEAMDRQIEGEFVNAEVSSQTTALKTLPASDMLERLDDLPNDDVDKDYPA